MVHTQNTPVATSSTPLLAPVEYSSSNPAPIPWRLLVPILLIRIVDSISYILVFPFITEFITSLHAPHDKVGLYAGLAEGCLMAVEAFCATSWARAADRWGRKRCLVWGVAVTGTGCALVGFGQSVGWIIFWRAFYGLTPAGVLTRTVVAEISHSSNRSRIFAIYSPMLSLGVIIGNLIGGELAKPYGKLPWWMGGSMKIWQHFPYALPCVVCSILSLSVVVLCWYTLEETKKSPEKDQDEDVQGEARETNTFKAVLQVPQFMLVMGILCSFQLASFAFEGLFTVFLWTPVKRGGLGLPVHFIGLTNSLSSAIYILVSPVLAPLIEDKFGLKGGLALTSGAMPLEALVIPLAQFAATKGLAWTGVMLGVQCLLKNFHCMGWSQGDNLIFAVVGAYPELTASASAIQCIAGAIGRASGPVISGWVFSFSTAFPAVSLGRQLSWIVLFIICLPPLLLVTVIPRLTEDGKDVESQVEVVKENKVGYEVVGAYTVAEGYYGATGVEVVVVR
ncbi:hypothetical protein I350_04981 [Cryptococcus amylolentus CBS 6273]|uniref:Major facilitator superfamily (MFS) profile domain-containing protein n=1 Tax=Cryptococcus amylolentus CBS 6273 TaxID=1296118 RepID=A0A1E3JYK6_9TREE|nr:hypothetical protein I350_04981 [Cryptococcus amylolentus CBS 6273]